MKKVLSIIGINTFIAIKNRYNLCVDSNDFYKMLKRRLQYSKPKDLAIDLKYQFLFHHKEVAQYQ